MTHLSRNLQEQFSEIQEAQELGFEESVREQSLLCIVALQDFAVGEGDE